MLGIILPLMQVLTITLFIWSMLDTRLLLEKMKTVFLKFEAGWLFDRKGQYKMFDAIENLMSLIFPLCIGVAGFITMLQAMED